MKFTYVLCINSIFNRDGMKKSEQLSLYVKLHQRCSHAYLVTNMNENLMSRVREEKQKKDILG